MTRFFRGVWGAEPEGQSLGLKAQEIVRPEGEPPIENWPRVAGLLARGASVQFNASRFTSIAWRSPDSLSIRSGAIQRVSFHFDRVEITGPAFKIARAQLRVSSHFARRYLHRARMVASNLGNSLFAAVITSCGFRCRSLACFVANFVNSA